MHGYYSSSIIRPLGWNSQEGAYDSNQEWFDNTPEACLARQAIRSNLVIAARNTKELRDKAREFEEGVISREEYDFADSMKRNELSNMAFYIQSVFEVVILAVIVGGMSVDTALRHETSPALIY